MAPVKSGDMKLKSFGFIGELWDSEADIDPRGAGGAPAAGAPPPAFARRSTKNAHAVEWPEGTIQQHPEEHSGQHPSAKTHTATIEMQHRNGFQYERPRRNGIGETHRQATCF